jgi:hypothetical protein
MSYPENPAKAKSLDHAFKAAWKAALAASANPARKVAFLKARAVLVALAAERRVAEHQSDIVN